MTERDRGRTLQRTRAGFVSRVVAAALDVVIVFLLLLAGEAVVGAARFVLTDEPLELPDAGVEASSTLLLVLLVVVLSVAWSGTGRTIGNNVVGLRVVREDGGALSWPRALVRALVVVMFHVVSMGWILVSRKNAGLHDLVCRTAVVYDWSPRRAARPSGRTET
jgi:uncharacterized RDD family membrane protein YckC